jgi:hypothetical protein
LQDNPGLTESIVAYAKLNLNDLLAEMPELLKQRKEELVDESFTMMDLLKEN